MTQAGVSPAGWVQPFPDGDALRSGTVPRARRLLESRPWLVDSTVALVYTIPLVIIRAVALATGVPGISAWHLPVAVLTGAALLFRRHYPLTVLAAVVLLTTVLTWSLDANLDILAVPIALYAVALYRSPRQAWLAAGVAFAVGVAGLQLWAPVLSAVVNQIGENYDQWNLLLILALSMAVAVMVGSYSYTRAERVRSLVERAEQLARERDRQAQLATLAERSRIAREMHDIVAHSLSVMVSLADGATATAERDPARTKAALDQLSETGRSAIGDMRRLLCVLGDSSDSSGQLQPAPGSRDLSVLVERFRTAGLPIRYSVTGVPHADAARELTIYRIVQEALTNVLRYSLEARTVAVSIAYSATETDISVHDDGRRRSSPAASVGTGRGIIGMGERAAVHGGSVTAGPLPECGWRVHAVLPVTAE
ncbi:histidine kinase [Arthrobacter sp. EH-1B-1]|uniref:histidine kinase n=1 Tax=Arthrobacter vasquezii TaxID=2977629 RepID=A0ABT6CSW3_9MICC|nr:histidine kinase [Arthrobacter vasquezii]MDF9276209.1 histidine kinase [Arthrobacter vasquezii]